MSTGDRQCAALIWRPLILGSLILLQNGYRITSLPRCGAAEPPVAQAATFWTTGNALLPAWGFYPLNAEYGGTRPLGEAAAWNASDRPAVLTWVAEFPIQAEWQVWVRQYGGYGTIALTVDERPLQDARGGPGGGRFVWRHAGSTRVDSGPHHLDIVVTHGMCDAILLTSDPQLDPGTAALPASEDRPRLRANRSWRTVPAGTPRKAGCPLLIGTVPEGEETLYDWVPHDKQPAGNLRLWGAAGQYINGTLVARADDRPESLRVSLTRLAGSDGATIAAADVDVRVVLVWERLNHLYHDGRTAMLVPELLLRDDRFVGQSAGTATVGETEPGVQFSARRPPGRQGGFGGGACRTLIPRHQSRQFWLTVHVPPGFPPGLYRGELVFERLEADQAAAAVVGTMPVELEILLIDLQPAEGCYGIYYPSQPVDPQRPNYVAEERYLAELRDQVRHGLNTVTLYGGFSTLKFAREAGMTRAPCLMHWPDGAAAEQVAEAKRLGFDDLYFYGVDEPRTDAQIDRCRREAERRLSLSLHMFTAVNSTAAWNATRDFIDRPVYNLYVFGGRDATAARYARDRGFQPVSYWTTATAFPLWFRALTGLYNHACGYLGSSPWAYQDFPDNRLYAADQIVHRVAYPDELGEPIPTLAWEAHRAGIDDVRYLEALDRTLGAASQQLALPDPPPELEAAMQHARQVRKIRYESVQGRWFEYLGQLRPGDLDQARREMAEAIVRCQNALEGPKRP